MYDTNSSLFVKFNIWCIFICWLAPFYWCNSYSLVKVLKRATPTRHCTNPDDKTFNKSIKCKRWAQDCHATWNVLSDFILQKVQINLLIQKRKSFIFKTMWWTEQWLKGRNQLPTPNPVCFNADVPLSAQFCPASPSKHHLVLPSPISIHLHMSTKVYIIIHKALVHGWCSVPIPITVFLFVVLILSYDEKKSLAIIKKVCKIREHNMLSTHALPWCNHFLKHILLNNIYRAQQPYVTNNSTFT